MREFRDNEGGRTFVIGGFELTLTCTMQPHDILKVSNIVEIHALRHVIQHLQF
jgi:hypothetical protein